MAGGLLPGPGFLGGPSIVYVPPNAPAPLPLPTPAPTIAPATVPTITGMDPVEVANAIYGKVIPISVLGKARIGGALHVGPWFSTDGSGNRTASFGISFGFPADPGGTRVNLEIALDSKVVWDAVSGWLVPVAQRFTFRFVGGSLTQPADTLEIAHFGANAVAYRPQMQLYIEDLALVDYQNQVPYVACLIGDTTAGADPDDGINLGEGFERLAASPWLEETASFESDGITDIAGGMIFAEDKTFLGWLQDFARIYRSWDILQTDKLRVVDRGASITPDFLFSTANILDAPVTYQRQSEGSVPRELEFISIDPQADYLLLPSKAQRPAEPVTVTGSNGKETLQLPVILDGATRMSLVTFAKYQEECARKRVTLTAMVDSLEIEPGDRAALIGVADGFRDEVFKVIESTHESNFTIALTLESIPRCAVAFDFNDPLFAQVIFLFGADGANGSTAFRDESIYEHTVTAVGTAEITTVSPIWGSGSLLLDGGGEVTVTPSAAIAWLPTSTDELCIELHFRFASHAAFEVLIAQNFGLGSQCFELRVNEDAISELRFRWSTSGVSFTNTMSSSGAAFADGTDYYVCVCHDSSHKWRMFIGPKAGTATMVGSSSPAVTSPAMAASLDGMTLGGNALGGFMDGVIDECRITKGESGSGAVRHGSDADFAAPTTFFPRGEF